MRIRTSLGILALVAVFALPASMLGQFQKPTDEELKMTADPKYPGASAIYLNVVHLADNPHHFESFYARIKILSEKGASLGTVELPYVKDEAQREVAGIQGRTIHPDGTIVPLVGKPSDLLVAKQGDAKLGRKVFNLPSIQVGSIIEYYYQLRYGDEWYLSPTWQVQRDYPVRKAHYMFTPFQGNDSLSLWSILPVGTTVNKDALGRFSLDMNDIPPAPDEEWMPPIANSLYRVEFYFRDSSDADAFWRTAGNNWSHLVDQFCDPSKSLRETVNGLLAPSDTELDKARKLYKAVQQLDNSDYSREKSDAERKSLKLKEVKRAEDVWTQKSGTSTEIALLYLSMLRAAGLSAYAMRVVDRDRGMFTLNYMNFSQLDDTFVILSTGGQEVLLDPGERMCPFQTVSWRHSSASGVRQVAGGSAVATSPAQAYTANAIQRVAEITLDPHGAFDADIRINLTGQEALYWRQKALKNDEAEVKKQFDSWIAGTVPEGVEAHIDHFNGLDDPDSNLAAVVKAHGTVGTATAKRLLLPALFFETRGSHPFAEQEKRLTPVDMHYGETISDDVTYRLPPGLEAEGTSEPVKVPWQGHAVLIIKSKADPGKLTVNRTLARAFTFASSTDYPALRDFYQRVAAADQQQLVLHATEAPKGN
jgi:hypothetical protein